MKRQLQLFLLIVGACFIHSVSFGQDSLGKVYSIKFSGYKTHLSKEAKATLSQLARTMSGQTKSHFAVIGCCSTENQRLSQASWDRINNIINHLVKKPGIKSERFIFKYDGEPDDCTIIEIKLTEGTPETVPPPHPNLRKKSS